MSIPVVEPHSIPGVTMGVRRALRKLYRACTWLSPRFAARLALALFVMPGKSRLPPRDAAVMARARRRRVPFQGGYIQTYEWGRRGPAVLLLHGWSSRVGRLSHFVNPLRDAGFRVVGFDAPAHGASSGWRSDLTQFSDALGTVLDTCGPIRAIVAHSFGARATVRHLAERPRPEVTALVLIGIPPDVRFMMEQFKLVLDLRADVRELLVGEYVKTYGRAPEQHSPEEHAAVLVTPALVVHDEADEVAPVAHAIGFVKQLPRAAMLLTRGLGHCELLRHRPTIARIAGFLALHLNVAPPVALWLRHTIGEQRAPARSKLCG